MLLSKLFKGAPDLEIEQLSIDSRLSMKNAIFFCLDGIKYDGHDYIEEAIKNGAKVIVYSKEQEQKFKAIYIKVANVNNTLTKAACQSLLLITSGQKSMVGNKFNTAREKKENLSASS